MGALLRSTSASLTTRASRAEEQRKLQLRVHHEGHVQCARQLQVTDTDTTNGNVTQDNWDHGEQRYHRA
eukprot:7675741-Pyramimonas_sp.AAC.1